MRVTRGIQSKLRNTTTSAKGRTAKPKSTVGFGCPNEQDSHHFIVTLPTERRVPVLIAEHYGTRAPSGYEVVERCALSQPIWAAFADIVRAEFNQRLKKKQLPTSQWKRGENKVERLLGKELLVLAWAIEQADLSAVPQAVRNWQGLQPEERWWLCTMTAAATGGLGDVGKGWRQALYHILVENPVGGGEEELRDGVTIALPQ
jgi:hypothetical protein